MAPRNPKQRNVDSSNLPGATSSRPKPSNSLNHHLTTSLLIPFSSYVLLCAEPLLINSSLPPSAAWIAHFRPEPNTWSRVQAVQSQGPILIFYLRWTTNQQELQSCRDCCIIFTPASHLISILRLTLTQGASNAHAETALPISPPSVTFARRAGRCPDPIISRKRLRGQDGCRFYPGPNRRVQVGPRPSPASPECEQGGLAEEIAAQRRAKVCGKWRCSGEKIRLCQKGGGDWKRHLGHHGQAGEVGAT